MSVKEEPDHNHLADLINKYRDQSLQDKEEEAVKKLNEKCEAVKSIATSVMTKSIADDELKDEGIGIYQEFLAPKLNKMSLPQTDPMYEEPSLEDWRKMVQLHKAVRAPKASSSNYERNGILQWMHRMLRK